MSKIIKAYWKNSVAVDPKLHKRGQKIEGNKELYKTNKDVKLSRREMEKVAGDLEKANKKK